MLEGLILGSQPQGQPPEPEMTHIEMQMDLQIGLRSCLEESKHERI